MNITVFGSELRTPVIAIGNFDGVHRGHATVLKRVQDFAKERGVSSAVMTFDPHPIEVFKPGGAPFRIMTKREKRIAISNVGIDSIAEVTFNKALSALSPQQFIEQILVNELHVSAVFVGSDFRFGNKRAGDANTLKTFGEEFGFEVVLTDLVPEGTEPITSTRIRGHLRDGDVTAAEKLLGHPFQISGTVVHGEHIGTGLGFPTANLSTGRRLLPHTGIYAAWATTIGTSIPAENKRFMSATYIGDRPTFDGDQIVVESFLISDDDVGDLYGQSMTLEFVAFIRDDVAYTTVDALKAQMAKDVAAVRKRLS